MFKYRFLILLIIGLATCWQKGRAQSIFYSDAFGALFTVNIADGGCDVVNLGQMSINGNPFTPTDIAFHPNTNLYATDGISLYEIDLTSLVVTFIGNHNLPGDQFITGLVCDNDGVMYGADLGLFTINISNGSAINLGNMPCESAGDLAFNGGDLYLACVDNELLRIDLDNIPNSQIIGTMQASAPFFGIVTFATECSDVQTYGTAGNSLYQINVETANSTFTCTLEGTTEVYGAAMNTDFIAADCDYFLDLDGDDSSGALDADFFADTICGNNMTMIADGDFEIIADGVVDSVVIDIASGLMDGTAEQLLLLPGQTDNFDILGSGTNHIQLVANGMVELVDIAHVLENTKYVNMANPYTPGERQVTVQIFAQGENTSNVATAFIFLVAAEPFSIDLGVDTTLCEGESLVLNATYEGAIAYEWQNGSTEATFELDGFSTGGLYEVTVTDVCGSTATDDIVVDFIPPVAFLELGADTILCPGESLLLDATLPDGIGYEWNEGTIAPMLTVFETGFYSVNVTAGCGIQTDEIFVEFQEVPTISVLPEDTLLCQGRSLSLDATLPNALTYTWEDGSDEPLRVISEPGLYEVMVELQCGDYFDEVEVVTNDYELEVDLGRDSTFCFMDSVVLVINNPYAVSYLWNDGSTEAEFSVNQPGGYAVTISDGCTEVSDQIFLGMISCCEVFVPNVFSPNFDGINDILEVYSNCTFSDFDFRIYNRWGAQVFQSETQLGGWGGVYQGKPANEGVYVWLLKYNDGLADQVISGDVTLVR